MERTHIVKRWFRSAYVSMACVAAQPSANLRNSNTSGANFSSNDGEGCGVGPDGARRAEAVSGVVPVNISAAPASSPHGDAVLVHVHIVGVTTTG